MRDTAMMARPSDAPLLAGTIALVSVAAIGTVWALQARGYAPCGLCLKERIPYYLAVPVAAALALLAPRLPRRVERGAFALLALLFAAGTALGAYHAGVEWKLWAGPTECSGAAGAPAAVEDFLKQLNSVAVVRCDQVALQVLGLSLAAWNALLAAGLAILAALGWR